jgi:NAD(P)H-dependent FMN reductase
MRLMVILGSVREGRAGETIAKWVNKAIGADDRFELDFVDVKELGLPFYDEPAGGPFTVAASPEGYKNPKGKTWSERVAAADGFLILTAEYNHGIPASLKNALDWVGPAWSNKPASFVCYGYSAGGARAGEQLRGIMGELGMLQIRETVVVQLAIGFDEHNEPKEPKYNDHLKAMLDHLFSLSEALKK